jgi:acetylcholinesterase
MRLEYILLFTFAAVTLADDIIVLKQGSVKGHRLTSRKGREIFAFQGIPYAEPPVGELRFQVSVTL